MITVSYSFTDLTFRIECKASGVIWRGWGLLKTIKPFDGIFWGFNPILTRLVTQPLFGLINELVWQ